MAKYKFSDLLTISEFCREEGNINRLYVYRAIDDGSIKPIVIGKGKHIFIDPSKYTGMFNNIKPRYAKDKN